MTEKLRAIEERYEALARQLEDPAVYGDPEKLKKLNREQKELAPVVEAFRAYRRAESDLRDAQELLSDPEMKEMAQEELESAKETIALPPETIDDRFRAAPGEGTAWLFAGSPTGGHVGGGFLYTNRDSVSIGLVATHIDEKGFVRVGAVGGVSAKEVMYAPVRFRNGTRGLVCAKEGAELDKLKVSDLYLDIGAASGEEAEKLVQVGDAAVYDTPVRQAAGRVISPYLDDRIACLVLLMAMERLGKGDNDLYFVFSTQEEVGCRGAKTASIVELAVVVLDYHIV